MHNRVRQTSTTTGTGDISFAATPTGFRAFAAVYSTGQTIYYVIEGVTDAGVQTGEWEVGLGQFTAGGGLQRDTVHASSNAGSLVDLAAGTKRVYDAVTVEAAEAIADAQAAVAVAFHILASDPHGDRSFASSAIAAAIGALGEAADLDVGTGAGTVAAGDDSRFSDARTPTSHASTHQNGGSDEIATTTPAVGAIPKAGTDGFIDPTWLPDLTPSILVAGDAGLPGWQVTGSQTTGFSGIAGRSLLVPIFPDQDITLDRIHTVIQTAAVGGLLDISVWECELIALEPGFNPTTRVFNQASIDASSTGLVTLTGVDVHLDKGKVYAIVGTVNGAITIAGALVNAPGLRCTREASGFGIQVVQGFSSETTYPAPSTWVAPVTSQVSNGALGFRAQFTCLWTRGHA